MKYNIGIWIDKKKAMIVYLQGTETVVKVVKSGYEARERIAGESKEFGRFGNQFVNHEHKKELKQKTLRKHYLEEVVKEVKNVQSIVIFGPAETKIELKKTILAHHDLASTLDEVVTTDSMSRNQAVAWVKTYFEENKWTSEETTPLMDNY